MAPQVPPLFRTDSLTRSEALHDYPVVKRLAPTYCFSYTTGIMKPANETHEVFAKTPLALVVVEVRLPDAANAGSRPLPISVQRSFRDLLGSDWVIQSIQQQHLSLAIGPGSAVSQPAQPVTIPRFTVRDRTLAVALTEDSVTIETTKYSHYLEFRSILETAIAAAAEVLAPDGVARVGMRYINEIRVSGFDELDPSGWRDWVDPSLLAPQIAKLGDVGFVTTGWEGLAQYQTGPEQKLVLRYGPRSGFIVSPEGPLKRLQVPPPPGPLFGLDFDSFWEPADIPQFNAGAIVEKCDQLRKPIRVLFDLLLTDNLLAEFRKEATGG